MGVLEKLGEKYGAPRLTPTNMVVSQFEFEPDEDDELAKVMGLVSPSDALIFESFEEGIQLIFRGRFVTNLLPATREILMDLLLLPEGSEEKAGAIELAKDLSVGTREDFIDAGPTSAFNLSGKIEHFHVPCEGMLNFNLKFIIDDPDISSEPFPLKNTICSIPIFLLDTELEGGEESDG